jgi:hypothetical protein
MLRRYTATYDAEKAARAHAFFSPADRLNERLNDGGNDSRKTCALRRLPDDSKSDGIAIGLPSVVPEKASVGPPKGGHLLFGQAIWAASSAGLSSFQ